MANPRRSNSARCGNIKRKLGNGERLSGESLEFALEVLEEFERPSSDKTLFQAISSKLVAGAGLSDYESSMFIDIYLDLKKLSF